MVAPPAGSDVYLIARLWAWWPMLELEKGKTYKLHLTALDYNHGFSLQPTNINIQVHPGYDHVLTVQPTRAGAVRAARAVRRRGFGRNRNRPSATSCRGSTRSAPPRRRRPAP